MFKIYCELLKIRPEILNLPENSIFFKQCEGNLDKNNKNRENPIADKKMYFRKYMRIKSASYPTKSIVDKEINKLHSFLKNTKYFACLISIGLLLAFQNGRKGKRVKD